MHKISLNDIINTVMYMKAATNIKDVDFEIETKRPPHYDGWECTVKFNGKDKSAALNQDICLFLEEFYRLREEVRVYQSDYESFRKWQDKTLAYHSGLKLEEKEIEELSEDERIRRFQAIMNERYGKKES